MNGLALPMSSGLVPVMNVAQKRAAEQTQAQPVIAGLAAHVKKCFDASYQAKQQGVEERLLQCVRQRRGEYDPNDLAEIRKAGGSEIYMMLTGNKCRAAASWIK